MIKTAILPVVGLALAAIAAPANATFHAEPMRVSVNVPYADLDLASEAGQAALQARLNAAERNICGLRSGPRDLSNMNLYRECLNSVRASYREELREKLADTRTGRVTVE